MRHIRLLTIFLSLTALTVSAADQDQRRSASSKSPTFYDIPPRTLIDMPTAGTLPRGYYNIGLRLYSNGGAIGWTDIGLSNRLQIGISYGADKALSNDEPNWNPEIEFSVKFRLIDELRYMPAVTLGYSSQGYGAYNKELKRYTYKSRGFYGVISRSFYFYKWTAGWHAGLNYSVSDEGADTLDISEKDMNLFVGLDATFNYNLALVFEYDAAMNDDRSANAFAGKGRGYLNTSVKWLFADNLELELIFKDLLVNRRESDTITREVRLTYIDKF